jgi:hypothetical protein
MNPSMNKMIADLVGMPPQQLAQYAAQNKDDTMKFLAAKAASDMQKKQMAMSAAQQQQAAAPPVADQVVDQMAQGLPEESGIGALPAPNMRGYAAGGIVAFADGGFNSDLFRRFLESVGRTGSDFANADPITKKDLLNQFGRATSGPQMSVPAPSVPSAPAAPGNPYAPATPGTSYADTKSARGGSMLRPLGAAATSGAGLGVLAGGSLLSRAAAGNLSSRSDEELDTLSEAGGGDDTALAAAIMREDRNTPRKAKPVEKENYRGSKDVPYTGAGTPSSATAAIRKGAVPQTRQGAGSGAVDAPRTGASGAGISALAAQQPEETSEAMFDRVLKKMPDARANLPKEIQEAEDIKTAQANKELKSEEDAKAGLASLLGKREARIGAREQRIADKSSNDVNMSLIDAGLAMMQSTGKGLAGIAEGAGVGMKRYAEESRLTEAARQKAEEARDAYDDLKFNREDMSRKQILAAEGKIADARVLTKTATIAEIARREDVNLKTAGKIFEAEAAKQLQGQTQRFQAGENAKNRATQVSVANAPNGQMQLAAALGNGNLEAGMRKMTEIAAGKFNIQEAYSNYLRTMGPGGMGVSPQEFAAQIRALAPQIRP